MGKNRAVSRRATYHLSSKLQNKKKRWHFSYVVYPPHEFPFLPSDEALRTLIERYDRIRFEKTERFSDHDALIVRGVEDNMFRTIAEPEQHAVRRRFLSEVGALGLRKREIQPIILEELERIAHQEHFSFIVWDGKHLVAHTESGHRMESHMRGRCLDPFKELYRLSKAEFPFSYEAAL